MIIDGLSWHQFSNLPHIASLPLNRQLIEYEIYNQNLIHEVMMIQQQQQMLHPNVPVAPGTGAKPEPIIEQNSGCIEFVADTTDSTFFEMNIGVSSETTYTVEWGDGTTSEGSLTDGSTWIEHNFPDSEEQYTVRMCFADPSLVTSLEFTGND